MMKKFMALLLYLVISFGLISCGKQYDNSVVAMSTVSKEVDYRGLTAQEIGKTIAEDFKNSYNFDSVRVEVEPCDEEGYSGVMTINSPGELDEDFATACSGYLDKCLKSYTVYVNGVLIIEK